MKNLKTFSEFLNEGIDFYESDFTTLDKSLKQEREWAEEFADEGPDFSIMEKNYKVFSKMLKSPLSQVSYTNSELSDPNFVNSIGIGFPEIDEIIEVGKKVTLDSPFDPEDPLYVIHYRIVPLKLDVLHYEIHESTGVIEGVVVRKKDIKKLENYVRNMPEEYSPY